MTCSPSEGQLLIDVEAGTSDVCTFVSEQCGVAGLVAKWFPIMLGVAPRHQCPAAALTRETELVPGLAHRVHLLSKVHGIVALGTLGSHGRWCSQLLLSSSRTCLGVAALSIHFLIDRSCQHDRKPPQNLRGK